MTTLKLKCFFLELRTTSSKGALREKVEPSSGFRKKVEDIVIDEEVVKVKEKYKDKDNEMDSNYCLDLQF